MQKLLSKLSNIFIKYKKNLFVCKNFLTKILFEVFN